MSRLRVTKWGNGHSYSLATEDGTAERVPGVTTVVSLALDKPALKYAAAKEVALYAATHLELLDVLGTDAWVRDASRSFDVAWKASADVGRQVHDIARRLVAGDALDAKDPDTGDPYPDDVFRMGEQAARFMDAWDVRPEDAVMEAPIFHEDLRYAGRMDLLAYLRDGRRWLLDFKTGASGVWPETAYQLAGYRYATHIVMERNGGAMYDLLMPEVERTGAVWLRPDGWQLIPVTTDLGVWDCFEHMVRVAKHVQATGPSKAQPRGALLGEPLPDPEHV